MLQTCIKAAEADLKLCEARLQEFESVRITRDTSAGELYDRFPVIGREIEREIKDHHWKAPPGPDAPGAH